MDESHAHAQEIPPAASPQNSQQRVRTSRRSKCKRAPKPEQQNQKKTNVWDTSLSFGGCQVCVKRALCVCRALCGKNYGAMRANRHKFLMLHFAVKHSEALESGEAVYLHSHAKKRSQSYTCKRRAQK